jgi:4-amino-4-deoxy-L-arabinose transferase-like glycosyltransferase
LDSFLNKHKNTVLRKDISAAAMEIKPKWLNSPIVPAAVVVFILLPFINKAFYIDDPLFIWSAQQIQKNPLDFYGFNVNWYGDEEPMFEVTKNPPLASYYIAAIGTFFGYGEVPLHIGFILPAIAVAIGTFYLARHFCSSALAAALIAVVNPVFLVSATTLMCDTMMLAFWVWALFFWIRGIETRRHLFLLLAAICSILCALTKYFGIALIPLVAVYAISQKQRFGQWVFYWLLPIVALALYQWWTFSLYGRGLLSDAFAYSTQFRALASQPLLGKVLISLAFAGGCLITALFYSHLLWSKKAMFAGIVAMIILVGLLYFFPEFENTAKPGREKFRGDLMVTMGLMIIAGVSLIGLTLDELRKHRDSKTLLIFLWIIGTFIFAAFINWAINARSLLPIAPAAGILIASRLKGRRISRFGLLIPLLPAAVIAIAVVWTDCAQANSARNAVKVIQSQFNSAPGKIFFEGHWGFQFYMEKAGYKPLNLEVVNISAGDFLVIPYNNTNIFPPPDNLVSPKRTFEFVPCPWLSTMNSVCGAGFHSQVWGPVPFLFGKIPPEIYSVVEAMSPK